MKQKYEYVSKKECAPARQKATAIMMAASRYLKQRYGYSFQPILIGSGRNKLVTRIKNGNQGFDLDYSLIIKNINFSARDIKNQFMNAFNYAIPKIDPDMTFSKDSTSAITIKLINKNQEIKYSFDFAIIKLDSTGIMHILRHDKSNGIYHFEPEGKFDEMRDEIKNLKKYNKWNHIREEYLKLKNTNPDPNKHSFSLLKEAVNKVINEL